MKRWSGGLATAALFGGGGVAVIVGVTIAVVSALQVLRGIGMWGWWGLWSAALSQESAPMTAPSVDFFGPGIMFALGVLVLLVGWVAVLRAATRAWPDRRDRSIPSEALSADAKHMLTGE